MDPMRPSACLAIALVCVLVLCACQRPTPTPTVDAGATQVALAVAVEATLTALAPTATRTPTATKTPTATATAKATPTSTEIPTVVATATPDTMSAILTFLDEYIPISDATHMKCRLNIMLSTAAAQTGNRDVFCSVRREHFAEELMALSRLTPPPGGLELRDAGLRYARAAEADVVTAEAFCNDRTDANLEAMTDSGRAMVEALEGEAHALAKIALWLEG